MGKLDGKIALVTGAGKGIGRGIALALASEGAAQVITSRTLENLEATAAAISDTGVSVMPVCGDIAEESHVLDVFNQIKRQHGRLHILVNNAGAFDGGPIDQLSTAAWDRVVATNLPGPFPLHQRSDADHETAGRWTHH